MKTDELIEMLGTNVEPVKSGHLRNTLLIALAAGASAAVCLMLAVLGAPVELLGRHVALKLVALTFTVGLVAAGSTFLVRAARPGKSGWRSLAVVGLLLVTIVSTGIAAPLFSHPTDWGELVFGPLWAACLFCIPLFALVPFAALIAALRSGAPTNLARTGAIAGLVAGAIGATAFALHHSGSSITFVALWYGGPIILCAMAGAALGPRLLRW